MEITYNMLILQKQVVIKKGLHALIKNVFAVVLTLLVAGLDGIPLET